MKTVEKIAEGEIIMGKDTVIYWTILLRNNSEAGFSADKRWFGWTVGQRREDRIDTAITCTNLWHNLLNLYTT